jgi:hypothetical protein
MGEPAAATVAMCVLRAEHRDTGLFVTVTINPDVVSTAPGTARSPRPVGYATDVDTVLVLVQRFLRDFLHGALDPPDRELR